MAEKVLVYKEIYEYLRNKIFNGEFAPKCLLPSEYSLCSQFDASRETVRKALKLLENEGLIYSREKVGYYVSAPNHSDFTVHYVEDKEGLCEGIAISNDISRAKNKNTVRIFMLFIFLSLQSTCAICCVLKERKKS